MTTSKTTNKEENPTTMISLQRQATSVSAMTETPGAGASPTLSPSESWVDMTMAAKDNNSRNNNNNQTIFPASESSSSSSSSSLSLTAAVTNLLLSSVIFGLGFFYTEWFVPNHEHAYTRSHPTQEILLPSSTTTTTTSNTGGEETTTITVLDFSLNNPVVRPATVPSKLLHQTVTYLPLLLLGLLYGIIAWRRQNNNNNNNNLTHTVTTLLQAWSGHLTAMGLCEVGTHILKHWVLRRRPNFYNYCQFDTTFKACQAEPQRILESQLSFPSGHSSLSWCGMTFLVLVLLQELAFMRRRRQSNANHANNNDVTTTWLMWLACLLPWSWSSFVAVSRIVDYWHHPSDVLAGSVLGVLFGTVSFHIFVRDDAENQQPSSASTLKQFSSSSSSSALLMSMPKEVVVVDDDKKRSSAKAPLKLE